MTEKQKQWTAWAIFTAVTLALSLFLGVKYPIPEPPAELPDQIVTLGTTHMSALELSGSETDELVVNQTSTGDIVEFQDNGTVVWRLADGGLQSFEGNCLDLDADDDTSLCADTDDQIDYELGGADIFVMKQWGTSTITTDTTKHLFEIQDSTNVMTGGTNSLAGLNIDMGIGNSTAGTNAVYGLLIDAISQDAQNTETAIKVSSGWDAAADLDGSATVAGSITVDGTTPYITIGDAGAEDTKIVFDGAAQDFHIGLDDNVDDLVVGVGSALGTTTAFAIDENQVTTWSGGTILLAEAVSANNTIAATECGKTFFISGDDHTQTLPAVSGVSAGCEFRFIIAGAPTTSTVILTGNSDEDVLIGGINELEVDTNDDGPYDASADTITFVGGTAVVGDFVYMISDGSYFYISGQANADGGITVTDSD